MIRDTAHRVQLDNDDNPRRSIQNPLWHFKLSGALGLVPERLDS